ncbi:hypothetical protein, partial [Galliscardovia ingluviei]|uniref:hypothetical protein n=1 Tax=Galliscardovia ingluviei TaxID=1769422 RepID=UPI001E602C5A
HVDKHGQARGQTRTKPLFCGKPWDNGNKTRGQTRTVSAHTIRTQLSRGKPWTNKDNRGKPWDNGNKTRGLTRTLTR